MAHQSLYRRYRSQRFDEVLGQTPVTTALRNAVRDGRVGQAYLFSGPRGTGKTSTARILAKVLNCESPRDGEPDGTCEHCVAVREGRPVDWLHELDAASNGKVDDIRALLDRVSLGTSGRRKVYILDEVHMLSAGASNALLKTLEEPPEHVVFVLATTDPQKVLPTIKSRTQHFEFHLLPADVLADHVRFVVSDAGLDLDPDDVVEYVLRAGGGSARDTLSALDRVAAAGGVLESTTPADDLVDALCAEDPGAALAAVDGAVRAGRDPRVLGAGLVESARDAFLVSMGAGAASLSDRQAERARVVADALGPAKLTRTLETVGAALVEMRQAPDPRIPLEVAVVQLARPQTSSSLEALIRRIETLESRLDAAAPHAAPSEGAEAAARSAAGAGATTPGAATNAASRDARAALARAGEVTATGPSADTAAETERAGDRSAANRPSLGAVRRARSVTQPAPEGPDAELPADRGGEPSGQPSPQAPREGSPEPVPAHEVPVPSRAELDQAWHRDVLGALSGLTRAMFRVGRFVESSATSARFALPNEAHRAKCEEKQPVFEAALADHFGRPVPVELVVGQPGAEAPKDSAHDEVVDVDALVDAGEDAGLSRLAAAFPGAELVEVESARHGTEGRT